MKLSRWLAITVTALGFGASAGAFSRQRAPDSSGAVLQPDEVAPPQSRKKNLRRAA